MGPNMRVILLGSHLVGQLSGSHCVGQTLWFTLFGSNGMGHIIKSKQVWVTLCGSHSVVGSMATFLLSIILLASHES